MSRSNNTDLVNPAKPYFFEWSGSAKKGGVLKWFDKSKGEKGENVTIPLPFTFIVLDQLNSITGFSKALKSGLWSNAVRNLKEEPLTVRSSKGIEKSGMYADMADILNKGGKFGKNIFIAFFNDKKELIVGHLLFSGSAVGPWIDFCKKNDVMKIAVQITGYNEVDGEIPYRAPIFKTLPVSETTNAQAIELDKSLQEYLSVYLKGQNNKDDSMSNSAHAEDPEYKPNAAELAELARQQEEADSMTFTQDDSQELPF